jgi:RimJ/RimL family protein N-acetyltransferase
VDTQGNKIVFLQGNGFYFRPLEVSDLDRCQKWINDQEVRHFLKMYLPMNQDAERKYLESLATRTGSDVSFAIVLEDGDRTIGNIALHRISWKDRLAFTGTVIGEKDCWGQGWGTKAKFLLLGYAFDALNLHKVRSRVYSMNPRSLACQKRCGYLEEGVSKKEIFRGGKYYDVIDLGIFREQYRKALKKYLSGKK